MPHLKEDSATRYDPGHRVVVREVAAEVHHSQQTEFNGADPQLGWHQGPTHKAMAA